MSLPERRVVYKLRHKDTGLYASGGTSCKFGKEGKAWDSLGKLKNHLNQYVHYIEHKSFYKELANMAKTYLDSVVLETYQLIITEEQEPDRTNFVADYVKEKLK